MNEFLGVSEVHHGINRGKEAVTKKSSTSEIMPLEVRTRILPKIRSAIHKP